MSLLSYYTFAQSNVSNDTNDIYFTKYPLLDSLANENRYLVCRYFRYVSKLSAFVNFKNNLNHKTCSECFDSGVYIIIPPVCVETPHS